MAVTRVYQVIEEQEGSKQLGPVRRYKRKLIVTTDDIKDGMNVIYLAIAASPYGIIMGAPYQAGNDSDPGAHVVFINPKRRGGNEAHIWDVTIDYSTDNTGVDNPINAPAEFSITPAQFQRPMDRDLDDKPVVNSAKQPFDPPVEVDDSRPVLVVVKNKGIDDFNLAYTTIYQDAINTDIVYGWPAYTWKINISANTVTIDSGFQFWQVTYQLHARRELWYPLKVLNQGYYELKLNTTSGSKERRLIREKGNTDDDQPLTSPALLDANGSPIALTAAGELTQPPTYAEFNAFKRLSFAPLQLPPLPTGTRVEL